MDDSKNNENEKKSGPETSSVAPGAKEYAPPVEGMDYIDRNHMTKASRLRERLMDQMFSKFADELMHHAIFNELFESPGYGSSAGCGGSCKGECAGNCKGFCESECTGDCTNTVCKGQSRGVAVGPDWDNPFWRPDYLLGEELSELIARSVFTMRDTLRRWGYPR